MLYNARHALLGWMIVKAVPALNVFRKGLPWHTPLDDLRHIPDETWGKQTYLFLTKRGLGFLPKYEHHDALHVLLGYEADTIGEIRLQSFMVGNGTRTFAGWVLYYLGLMILPECREQMKADFRRGASSNTIDWLRVEPSLSHPLESVRQSWGIDALG
jgi:ubiquinone biosynthesis protein Coq4